MAFKLRGMNSLSRSTYKLSRREKIIIAVLFAPLALLFLITVPLSAYEYSFNSYTMTGTVQSSKYAPKRGGLLRLSSYSTDVVFDKKLNNGKNGDQVQTGRQYLAGEQLQVKFSKRHNGALSSPWNVFSLVLMGAGIFGAYFIIRMWKK